MDTVTLKTGAVVPEAVCTDIMRKLSLMRNDNPGAFFRIVKACRNPQFSFKQCPSHLPIETCRGDEHKDCWDIEQYSGLVLTLDDDAHGDILPVVRAIVLAATPGVQMPRLISPLLESGS